MVHGAGNNAKLTAQLESANANNRTVDRVNSLLSGMMGETRDVVIGHDEKIAATHTQELAGRSTTCPRKCAIRSTMK